MKRVPEVLDKMADAVLVERPLWKTEPMKANAYQIAKAKKIAAFLLECREQSTLGRLELAKVVAIMDAAQWQTVCFAAGVPVADLSCKAAVLALLRGRSIHAITSSRTSVTA